MTFTPNIPFSGQTLGNSRTQVLNNFAVLRSTLSNPSLPNHIDVNSLGAGKHIFVEMPVQTPSAANLPGANEGGMITQTVSGKSELFYARDNIATYFRMTGDFLAAVNGYTTIFGGLLFQWGTATVTTLGTSNNFPIPFPNNLFSLVLTPITAAQYAISISASNLTSFTVKGGNSNAFFLALGN